MPVSTGSNQTQAPGAHGWRNRPAGTAETVVVLAGAGLLLAPLAGYAYLGTFSRYAADDYCTAGQVVANGLLGMEAEQYLGWSGRFSFLFAVGALESVGDWVVPLLPAVALLALVAVTTWTVAQLRLSVRRSHQLLLAALLVTATLGSTPDLGQSLFWQTGMLTYLAPLIPAVAYLGLLRRSLDRPAPPQSWMLVLAGLLCFVAGGSSETYVGLQTGGLALGIGLCALLAGPQSRRRLGPLLGAGLLGSAVAAGLIIAAPGNAIRGRGHPTPMLLFALTSAVDDARQFVHIFFRFSFLQAALLVAIPALLALSPTMIHVRRSMATRSAILLLLVAVMFALLTFAFAPSYYAVSGPVPARARVVPQFVLVCAVACAGYLGGSQLRDGLPGRARPALRLAGTAASALVLVTVSTLALRQTLTDLPSARDYAARWDSIDQQIRTYQADGRTDVRVPGLAPTGLVRGMDFLAPTPDDWLNQCAARYYRVRSITAVGA
jgi:Family of unknown function (DUF6056)